ncbi:MAG: GreA/GreB family elongation factor [Verrucomicrobiota bacterium]
MNEELVELVETGRLSQADAERLDRISPGKFCNHRSWGGGEIKEWSLREGKLVIDFEGKPNHGLGLKFALKSLEPISQDHVIARRLKDPAALKTLAKEEPVEFLREALKSHDDKMKPDQIEELVKGSLIPEADYKSWWEGAKKKLRQARDFSVPQRRTEFIELRSQEISAAEHVVGELREARDVKSKLVALKEIRSDLGLFEGETETLQAALVELEGDLSSLLKMQPPAAIELMVLRNEILAEVPALDYQRVRLIEILQQERENLAETLQGMGVGILRAVMSALPEAYQEEWSSVLLAQLRAMAPRPVAEGCRYLIEQGQGEPLFEFLRLGLQDRSLTDEILTWICRERKGLAEPVFDAEVAGAIVNSLEQQYYDEEKKAGSKLQETMVNDRDLIPDLMDQASKQEVRFFTRRLLSTPVFDDLTRKSLLARVIKKHPAIQDIVTGSEEVEEPKEDPTLIVSWDSLQKRKEEFEDLVNKQIPANTKEISIARSYGDLRENFEFKAAKQQQAVLLRRKEELEREIDLARGINYQDADPSRVNIGTVVKLSSEQGEETLTILGAWDSDPDQGLISYKTTTGSALLGAQVGAEVHLPTEPPRVVKVLEISKYA